MLQKLIVKLTGENVSWSSTGGDCKMLKLNEVEVRGIATTSKSLIINGVRKEDIKSQLDVVNSNSDNTTKLDGEASGGDLSESQSIGSSNSETLINIVRSHKVKVNIELNNFRSEIQNLKTNFQLKQTRQET